ncbi:hypothetical protein PhCBS80983_g03765 [Powellomyces hirtus]|uniref:Cyclin N-terminal domain-containing protein n=1 Tax=Powellomyces hirtus TaxID=109895 RepID=A0A507E0D2_9FUNG|nr:hypothetical protein PhCBS80983_g03765 [Powellomyces hirtus]
MSCAKPAGGVVAAAKPIGGVVAPDPAPNAFWHLDPQEFKRQGNLQLLANNAVYDVPALVESADKTSCSLQQSAHVAPLCAPLPNDLFPRKEDFVESLVDTAAAMLELQFRSTVASNGKRLVPLKAFIQELLKRSRTSFSTLQLSLLYLLRFKQAMATNPPSKSAKPSPVSCARRMFLSSLIVANKYLQDRNYSNTAWSRICGLPATELTRNENCFLSIIDWKLFVSKQLFVRWSTMLLTTSAQMTKSKAGKALVTGAAPLSPDGIALPSINILLQSAQQDANAFMQHRNSTGAPLTPPAEFGERTASFSKELSTSSVPGDLWCGAEKMDDLPATDAAAGYLPSPEMRPAVVVGTKRGIDQVDTADDATSRRVSWPAA